MKLGIALVMSVMMMSPPSGRPPIGPLERYEPKLYDLTFHVSLNTLNLDVPQDLTRQRHLNLENAPIVMPIIFQGAFSKVHQDSLHPRLWLMSREYRNFGANSKLQAGFPHHTQLYAMTVERFTGTAMQWQLTYRTQSWSSRLDDQWAANLTWPREWPDDVRDGLKPSQYIESDRPIFANSLQRLTNGNLRMAPPYLAAKAIVRYTISRFKVSGSGTDRGRSGVIRGLNVKGAAAAWENGLGTEHDLLCCCIAMLRAADIPARPVIGVMEVESKASRRRKRKEFVSWGEFYLEGAGWIPFDPNEMRGYSINNMNLREPWREFGTMKDLNERIPVAYAFVPEATVEVPWKPCVWGWDPRPGGGASIIPQVSITMISRGKGQEDPR